MHFPSLKRTTWEENGQSLGRAQTGGMNSDRGMFAAGDRTQLYLNQNLSRHWGWKSRHRCEHNLKTSYILKTVTSVSGEAMQTLS